MGAGHRPIELPLQEPEGEGLCWSLKAVIKGAPSPRGAFPPVGCCGDLQRSPSSSSQNSRAVAAQSPSSRESTDSGKNEEDAERISCRLRDTAGDCAP